MSTPNALIASDHGPIIVNLNDSIGRAIAATGYWAQGDIALIRQILEHLLASRSVLTFYDVGANIGTHTLAVARIDPARIRVRAFEAQRQVFHMLCGTLALNGLRNVQAHLGAVSDRSGETIEIALPDYDQPGNFGGLELLPPARSDNTGIARAGSDRVTTVKLDDFDEQVDFIKMDIEGMESLALAGARQLFARCRPACYIEILKTDQGAVFDFLRSLDYAGFLHGAADLVALPREAGLGVNGAPRAF